MTHYQERLVNLLDRKFELLGKLPPKHFLVELGNFVHFILVDEVLSVYVLRFLNRLKRQQQEYNQAKVRLVDQLAGIRSRIAGAFVDLVEHENIATFDRLSDNIRREISQRETLGSDDHSIIALTNELQSILKLKEGDEAIEQLVLELQHICDLDLHLNRRLENYILISPAAALLRLRDLVNQVNPRPQKYMSLAERDFRQFRERLSNITQLGAQVEEVVYLDKEHGDLIQSCKVDLRLVYEGLRAEIGSRLVHYELLNSRYKARCMWYDRERLTSLIEQHPSNEEHALTTDLALYLFDNGVSTLYRLKRGAHEYDLVDYQTENPIFIEVKVYKSSKNARRNLVRGVAQLHGYLNGCEAEGIFVEEAYYVVYRLGGPLYDLPWEIPTNRRTFYPIVVDLAPSQESGSRQPKPIKIALGEFFAEDVESGI